jgi:hypothetical protein
VLTVTTSLKVIVNVTVLPAFKSPLPFVMPDPESLIDKTVGAVSYGRKLVTA